MIFCRYWSENYVKPYRRYPVYNSELTVENVSRHVDYHSCLKVVRRFQKKENLFSSFSDNLPLREIDFPARTGAKSKKKHYQTIKNDIYQPDKKFEPVCGQYDYENIIDQSLHV